MAIETIYGNVGIVRSVKPKTKTEIVEEPMKPKKSETEIMRLNKLWLEGKI